MAIRIVTDSTCDLPEDLVSRYGVTVIPLYIHIGSQSYLDGVELTRSEFYERLPRYPIYPTTAVPGPGVFRQAYEQLAVEGATEILSIHIAESLSSMVNVAHTAAQEVHSVPITVFDSGQLSMGVGFAVLAAAEAAVAGHSMEEILDLLQDQRRRTHVVAVTDTFEYLRRSGRLKLLPFHLVDLLKIKPYLSMYDGESSVGIVRTLGKAMDRMLRLVEELGLLERLAVVHALVNDQAEELKRRLEDLLSQAPSILFAEVNPTIGVHVGPGCIGLACVAARSS